MPETKGKPIKKTEQQIPLQRRVMCDCLARMAGYYPESFGEHHHKECPKYKTEKFPQLFYEEDGLNAWVPAPDRIDNILVVADQFDEGEVIKIAFKRFDMTDEEMDSLPED